MVTTLSSASCPSLLPLQALLSLPAGYRNGTFYVLWIQRVFSSAVAIYDVADRVNHHGSIDITMAIDHGASTLWADANNRT